MTDVAAVPVGRLQGIERDWDFQSGWVRAPLREIVFNDRLSKQARLVWLWLASVPPDSPASWGECETLLRCGTKARRACISQLITEGFVSVLDNGIVVMHDPYEVFDSKRREVIDSLRDEWSDSIALIQRTENISTQRTMMIQEKKIDKELEKIQPKLELEPEPEEAIKPDPKPKKDESTSILSAWNDCKPETYTGMRRLSVKQRECIKRHLANLGLKQTDAREFICTICKGLGKSEFWSKTVAASGRNFNSVFGYGTPQDTKMKNIETLYSLGSEEQQEIQDETPPEYTRDQQDLIDAYRYSDYNHQQSRIRGIKHEAERWLNYKNDAAQQLIELGVNPDDI